MNLNNKDIVVSVCVTTYNHAPFLENSLISILTQETSFPFELIIGDDCSSDNTREILIALKEKYPDKITLIFNPENLGVHKNGLNILKQAKGKYIAICDGDDYWTYDRKLQIQIDFLESNLDYVGCFHDAIIEHATNPPNEATLNYFYEKKFYSQLYKYTPDFYPADVLERIIIPTGSLVFRNNNLVSELRPYDNIKYSLIWLYHLLIIKNSKFKYFNEAWLTYNNHKNGITKKIKVEEFISSNIKILNMLFQDSFYRHKKYEINQCLMIEHTYLFFSTKSRTSSFQNFLLCLKILYYSFLCSVYRFGNLIDEI